MHCTKSKQIELFLSDFSSWCRLWSVLPFTWCGLKWTQSTQLQLRCSSAAMFFSPTLHSPFYKTLKNSLTFSHSFSHTHTHTLAPSYLLSIRANPQCVLPVCLWSSSRLCCSTSHRLHRQQAINTTICCVSKPTMTLRHLFPTGSHHSVSFNEFVVCPPLLI